MTTAATAFAPGNPASAGIAQAALSGSLPGVSVPGFTSSSASGDISQGFNADNSGFNVNYGHGVSQGAGSLLLLAAAVVAGVMLWKKR